MTSKLVHVGRTTKKKREDERNVRKQEWIGLMMASSHEKSFHFHPKPNRHLNKSKAFDEAAASSNSSSLGQFNRITRPEKIKAIMFPWGEFACFLRLWSWNFFLCGLLSGLHHLRRAIRKNFLSRFFFRRRWISKFFTSPSRTSRLSLVVWYFSYMR